MTTQNSCSVISTTETIETSVQNLTKSWQRRRKWHLHFIEQETLQLPVWRETLMRFLDSAPVKAITVSFLLVDLVLTVLELSSSLLSCKPNGIEGGESGLEVLYHWIGVGILILLLIEVCFEVVGLGYSFFMRFGSVVDSVVLVVALILEAFVGRKGGGLVVVASLWRVVRVVESAFELSDEAIEAQIESVLCQFEVLKEENMRLLSTIADKDRLIEKLQEELYELKI